MQALLTPTPVTCYGSSDGTLRASVSGGMPPYQYEWSGQHAESNSLFSLSAGEYHVTVSDQNGCTITSTMHIQQPTPIVVSVTSADPICIGQSVTLHASASGGSPSYSYQWNTGSVESTAVVSPTTTSSYTVSATDANGCSSSPQTISVSVNPPLMVPFVSGDTICIGDQGMLHAGAAGGNGGPYNYQWSEGSSSNTIMVSPTANTQYTVTVTDNCGTPPVSQVVSMIVNPKPDPGFTPAPPQGCSGLEVHFYSMPNAIPVVSSTWEFGDDATASGTSTVHTYNAAGSYLVHHCNIR
ncbi:MAG: PKD domain-containing protein [Bacteroidetes bacterium]|nr:PKD domain-containing protein [Bacteroidota bacterium]